MNRFRFRFKSVLRYREIIEEDKKRGFGVALNHLKHEEAHLEKIENDITKHEEITEKTSRGKISARDLRNKFNYARTLDEKRDSQEKMVEKAGEEMESKRTDLVEATKRKKIFERLKERDREAYNEGVRKEEQKLSDELSSQRFKNHPE